MGLIRGIIVSVAEGVIKRFGATGRPGESFTNREYFQHYGFTSRPLAGAEAIIVNERNHIVMIASDDRRYRIGIETGEVALYTDEGDKVHLRRNREIEIVGGQKVSVVTEGIALIRAATKVTIEAPAIEIINTGGGAANVAITGDIQVNGSINATGSIMDGAGNTNHHSH